LKKKGGAVLQGSPRLKKKKRRLKKGEKKKFRSRWFEEGKVCLTLGERRGRSPVGLEKEKPARRGGGITRTSGKVISGENQKGGSWGERLRTKRGLFQSVYKKKKNKGEKKEGRIPI